MGKKGFWEIRGRKTAVAAFLMIGIVGGLYFFFGSLAGNTFVLIDTIANRSRPVSGDVLRNIIEAYRRYQVPVLAITIVFQYLFFVGLTTLIFRNWHALPMRQYFRIRAVDPLLIIVAALGGIALIPFVNFTGDLFSRMFPVLKQFEEAGSVLITVHAPWQWIFIILAIGVTPAVCEEFLFRGYFHRTLERSFAVPGVYFISGTIFALIHQNYFGLVALILVGSYLGFVYQRAGSIFASAATHFCYNTALTVLVNVPSLGNIIANTDGTTRWQAVVLSAVLGALAVVVMQMMTRGKSSKMRRGIRSTAR